MKIKTLFLVAAAASFTMASCKKDDKTNETTSTETQKFKVTIENIQTPYTYMSSGIFNTPVGATMPGGAGPGGAYEFTVHADQDSKLSFATMFVGSNDLFFGPEEGGIPLYNNGTLVTGDVTSQIKLWDAGTEVNEMPGSGANQPMNQSGPNTGPDENGTVRDIANVMDGFTYPSVSNTIRVILTAGTKPNEVVVRIENLSGSTTPIAPGVWSIHKSGYPIFREGIADLANGLEALAEDGSPVALGGYLEMNSGINTPFAPGVWAVHSASSKPVFMSGDNSSAGLEALAEDGNAAVLGTALKTTTGVTSSGVFNTPMGASAPGPIFPGSKYEFTFTATKGAYLSIATMYVQSNDLFYGFGQSGYELWSGNSAQSGDISSIIQLWDAGTEVNELTGFGMNQPPRQSAANTGAAENGTIIPVNDGYTYLMNDKSIRVTLSLN
jgi:hypothetical protein